MENTDKLGQELTKLNQKLDTINFNKSRFFVYNANPVKFALYNFIAGIFHSLGALFGTVVIAAAAFYFISQIDFISPVTNWLEQVMSQMNWQQIMPTPGSINTDNIKLDDKLLDQLQQIPQIPLDRP